MELLALFMYVFVSEPSVQFYKSFAESVSQQSESVGWGLGFRVRIPVGARDALRIRLDGRRFAAKEAPSSSSVQGSLGRILREERADRTARG
jgi:hypothetical protein